MHGRRPHPLLLTGGAVNVQKQTDCRRRNCLFPLPAADVSHRSVPLCHLCPARHGGDTAGGGRTGTEPGHSGHGLCECIAAQPVYRSGQGSGAGLYVLLRILSYPQGADRADPSATGGTGCEVYPVQRHDGAGILPDDPVPGHAVCSR